MTKVVVSGVPAFDGTYDLDAVDTFTGHELHLIKKVAGVRLAEIEDAMDAADYDLYVALAAIMVIRAGKATRQQAMQVVDLLLDADAGSVKFDFTKDEQEDDARPPEPESQTLESNAGSSTPSSPTSPDTGEDPPVMSLVSTGSLH